MEFKITTNSMAQKKDSAVSIMKANKVSASVHGPKSVAQMDRSEHRALKMIEIYSNYASGG